MKSLLNKPEYPFLRIMLYGPSICLYFLVVVFICSCVDSLHDVNENKNGITDVSSALLLPSIQGQSAKNIGAQPMRVAGIITNQIEGADICGPMNFFVIGRDVMDNFWRGGTYGGSLINAKTLEEFATERNEFFYRGVARIFLAHEFGVLTSCFGDIPFSQALQGSEFLQPKYDEQKLVYEGIQTLLDQAIDDLIISSENNEVTPGDLIFNGDPQKWMATAYALKARFYVHTSRKIPEHWSMAKQAAESALSYEFEDASLTFEDNANSNWTLNKFSIERPATIFLHRSFYQMLNGDPRRSKYSTDLRGSFHWLYHQDAPDLTWTQPDASVPLISTCELYFILAESSMRDGDHELALQYTKEGLKANFKMLGLSESDDYINNFNFGNDPMESLIKEAYKSYFGYNLLQVWMNYRRTGYPEIAVNTNTNSNGLNPSGTIPGRYMYVESEFNNNRNSLQEAEARQGGGLLDNKAWIDK